MHLVFTYSCKLRWWKVEHRETCKNISRQTYLAKRNETWPLFLRELPAQVCHVGYWVCLCSVENPLHPTNIAVVPIFRHRTSRRNNWVFLLTLIFTFSDQLAMSFPLRRFIITFKLSRPVSLVGLHKTVWLSSRWPLHGSRLNSPAVLSTNDIGRERLGKNYFEVWVDNCLVIQLIVFVCRY